MPYYGKLYCKRGFYFYMCQQKTRGGRGILLIKTVSFVLLVCSLELVITLNPFCGERIGLPLHATLRELQILRHGNTEEVKDVPSSFLIRCGQFFIDHRKWLNT